MVKLTENMVLIRSRTQDLENVRKLNCWGSELNDVSIVRRMPNIQLISLSVNKISSLEDFAYCPALEELYVRKNEISTLGEICYLKRLKKLRVVWLMDNPCADIDHYRLTVIRNLPQLEKLDNTTVTRDELAEAAKFGKELFSTSDCPAPLRSSQDLSAQRDQSSNSIHDQSTPRRTASPYQPFLRSSSDLTNYNTDRHKQSARINHELIDRPMRSIHAPSDPVPYKQCSDVGDVIGSFDDDQQSWHSDSYGSERDDAPVRDNTVSTESKVRSHGSSKLISVQKASPEKPSKSKPQPKSNSNVLQAVLCLVSELDQDSLEVLGDAIRNRLQREQF